MLLLLLFFLIHQSNFSFLALLSLKFAANKRTDSQYYDLYKLHYDQSTHQANQSKVQFSLQNNFLSSIVVDIWNVLATCHARPSVDPQYPGHEGSCCHLHYHWEGIGHHTKIAHGGWMHQCRLLLKARTQGLNEYSKTTIIRPER